MSAGPAVAVEHVSKSFRLAHQRPLELKERLLAAVRGARATHDTLTAVSDVSFTVARGEMFGLVGANGSGKSTLLQLVAGIYVPDGGRVAVRGRLRALLELGAGFSPELTGRENVFLNGALLGFNRADLRRRFDGIVAFAELEPFIDMPLKTYSSGMQMRLGFATAVHLDPDVLLLDEVLAVGDDRFQRKCLQRVRDIRAAGAAVVFISHDLVSVEQLCDRVALMESGRLTAEGRADDVIGAYRQSLADRFGTAALAPRRWGNGRARVASVSLHGADGQAGAFATGDPFEVRIACDVPGETVARPVVGLAIRRDDGTLVTGPNTKMSGYALPELEGFAVLAWRVPRLPLLPGTYVLAVSIYDEALVTAFDHWEHCAEFLVIERGTRERFGLVTFDGRWEHVPGGAA